MSDLIQWAVVILCMAFGCGLVMGISRGWFAGEHDFLGYLVLFALVLYGLLVFMAVPIQIKGGGGITSVEDLIATLALLPWSTLDEAVGQDSAVAKLILGGAGLGVFIECLERLFPSGKAKE